MKNPTSGTWLLRGIVAALASSGLILSWAAERSSVEHANRRYREGAFGVAVSIYEEHATAGTPQAAIRYNLGTSLLGLGRPAAKAELEAASESPPDEVRARAFYNVALLHLRQALEETEGDSLRARAVASVNANRSALRLRPDHPDTRWNLAMAQRLLDSIDAEQRRGGREMTEGAMGADAVVRSENMTDVENEEELPDDAPMQGEDEALAETSGEPPLTQAEAAEILSQTHLDATLIIQKLLSLESRGFRGRRLRRSGPPR